MVEHALQGTPNQGQERLRGHALAMQAYMGAHGAGPEAIAALRESLDLAEDMNLLQPYLEFSDTICALLSDLPMRGRVHRHLLHSCSERRAKQSAGKDDHLAARFLDPLSERELDVLQLIAQGRTNKEIAATLTIAIGTVKAHTASIYRKLDVNNRTHAVARARQLRLL